MKLLALLFMSLLIGCTEEISDKVKKSSSDSSSSDTLSDAQKFRNKSIRLINKMDKELSYILHRYGDVSQDCEIRSPSLGFKADDYAKNDPNYAIDCVLDVEELDLFQNGVKVELEVDEFLCEYIEYEPFRFANYLFGRSQNEYYQIECDDVCTADGSAEIRALCGKTFDHIDGSTTQTTFNPVTLDFSGTLASDASACYFDHGSANCDLGYIRKTSVSITGTSDINGDGDADLDGDGNPVDPVCSNTRNNLGFITNDIQSCGGDISQCYGGPGASQMFNVETGDSQGIVKEVNIFQNLDLEQYNISVDYTSPLDLGLDFNHNMYYANYSRVCANTSNAKTDFNIFADTNLVGSEVELLNTERLIFGGEVVSGFAAHLDNITGFDNSTRTTGWQGVIRDPFDATNIEGIQLAHHALHAYRAHNYYSFRCLDKARDVKAQIRLHIREWDKNFSEDYSFINQSSDADSTGTKYMDLENGVQDGTEFWNDFEDFDDFFIEEDIFTNNNNNCTLADGSDQNGDGIFNSTNADNAAIGAGNDEELHVRDSFPELSDDVSQSPGSVTGGSAVTE